MAIQTLEHCKEIGGYNVAHDDEDISDDTPIHVSDAFNEITFRIQRGPIKENGVNGCQVDTLIHTAKRIIGELNKKYPCVQNERAQQYLLQAIHELELRTKDREKRNVEGTSQQ